MTPPVVLLWTSGPPQKGGPYKGHRKAGLKPGAYTRGWQKKRGGRNAAPHFLCRREAALFVCFGERVDIFRQGVRRRDQSLSASVRDAMAVELCSVEFVGHLSGQGVAD